MPIIANKPVGPIGYGMMGLTAPWKTHTTDDAVELLHAALAQGANFWNAGLIYGSPEYNSCHLLNAYFTKYPEDAAKVCISIKGCFSMPGGKVDCSTAGVKKSVDEALRVLDGKCKIDVFQPARVDPDTPIEETVEAIAEYVRAGKVGGVGLSECSATTIRKAAKVHPIAAAEKELSMFDDDIFHNGVADACAEFGVPIVAYSPLGRGFLTGAIKSLDDLPETDFRRMMYPRFAKENFDANVKLVNEVERMAQTKGCTTAQVAIA